MTFENFTEGTNCDCLTGASENITTTFAHVLNKEVLGEKDFRSKYERWVKGGMVKPIDEEIVNDCEKMCTYKGVSISNVDAEGSKPKIITFYSSTFTLSPKYRRGVLIFKFKESAGFVKHTPTLDDTEHHDLYKSDSFNFEQIEEIETIYLGQAV